MTINEFTKAPKPMPPARGGVYVPRKEHYSVPVTDADYVRYITDGAINIDNFAALACDLSPPVNTYDSASRFYNKSLYDMETDIGIVFFKLKFAVRNSKIDMIEYNDDDTHAVSLKEGVAWLEKQPGIKVSARLKKYVADHFAVNIERVDSMASGALSHQGLFPNGITTYDMEYDEKTREIMEETKNGETLNESGEPKNEEGDIKAAVFKLIECEFKDKKLGRTEARKWFTDKSYPSTWGDDYINQLPEEQKRKRGRPKGKKI